MQKIGERMQRLWIELQPVYGQRASLLKDGASGWRIFPGGRKDREFNLSQAAVKHSLLAPR